MKCAVYISTLAVRLRLCHRRSLTSNRADLKNWGRNIFIRAIMSVCARALIPIAHTHTSCVVYMLYYSARTRNQLKWFLWKHVRYVRASEIKWKGEGRKQKKKKKWASERAVWHTFRASNRSRFTVHAFAWRRRRPSQTSEIHQHTPQQNTHNITSWE